MRVLLDNLGKSFKSTGEVLRGISLDIAPGEFVSFLGPSGCGKSTLLRIIAGLETPTSGMVEVTSKTEASVENSLSFVFQDARLLPWRSALKNVLLPLELLETPKAERRERAESVLRMVGLGDYLKTFPTELSGGMKMRVSLARALVNSPELLLLDEPFGALDEITRQTLNDELLRIWQAEGWTGLFVTHNIYEAIYLSQRIVLMGREPGVIKYECHVPFDYPRKPELRTEPAFGEIAAELMAQMEEVSA